RPLAELLERLVVAEVDRAGRVAVPYRPPLPPHRSLPRLAHALSSERDLRPAGGLDRPLARPRRAGGRIERRHLRRLRAGGLGGAPPRARAGGAGGAGGR